ncbi:MAG: hypothetical protein OXQ89_22915 [Rhodospirillaceae bacterium]|nr:hypothetical protein [Rhodospirillaceae bacterium]
MKERNPRPRAGMEDRLADRNDGALSPWAREVDLRVRYWGLLNTPEFERWKRRQAAGWGLDLGLFTESAVLDILLLNLARTYRSPGWRYVQAPRTGGANRRGRAGNPDNHGTIEPGDSMAPVQALGQGDALLDELVRRRIAGDPARSRSVRLSEYARMNEIRRALAGRHRDLGAVTDSQIADAMIAVFHGVETGRYRLSRSSRDVPRRATPELRAGKPDSDPRPDE